MEIINIEFEKPLFFKINSKIIKLVVFKTHEQGNIKFGIDAPSAIRVNREEIQKAFID